MTSEVFFRNAPAVEDGLVAARVTSVNRTNLELATPAGPCFGELTGRLRFTSEPEELPVAGDWVAVRKVDDFAMVTAVLDRRTVLRRRRPGSDADGQLLAANVDTAFVVHGCNLPVHPARLERFASLVRGGGVTPVIVLSKADLLEDPAAARESVSHIGEVVLSAALHGSVSDIEALLEPGKTYVLLGPSGAGKTTLLNALLGHQAFATGEVRAVDGKGRHTTSRRELIELESGAVIIDTPGVRELGMTDSAEGISDTFDEVEALAERCRFRDCSHQGEAGCAVEEAVDRGDLPRRVLESYLKLQREAERFTLSVAEKRRKDRAQGKLYKSIIHGKKDRR